MTSSDGSRGRPKVDFLYGFGYDPDVRVRRTTQTLAQAAYDVRILAWDRRGDLALQDSDGPVRIERFRFPSPRGRGLSQLLVLPRVWWAMLPQLRRRRPDVLHAIDLPMLLLAVATLPFLAPHRPRLVFDAFEIYSVMVAHRFPRVVLAAIGLLERWLPRIADLVITPGESRREWFGARGIDSIVVPNWIDPPSSPTDRSAARAAFGIEPGRFVIVYAGALLASRDLDALVGHAARCPGDLVLVAGTGDQEQRLRSIASRQSNLRVLGWLPDPSPLLAAADVMYYALRPDHPYAALAAPNNLYVAIAHGVPLVYRAQGELAVVGRAHEIGMPFTHGESLDLAVDRLRDPAASGHVREVLKGLRASYTWSAAVRPLVDAYPRKGTAARMAKPNGP